MTPLPPRSDGGVLSPEPADLQARINHQRDQHHARWRDAQEARSRRPVVLARTDPDRGWADDHVARTELKDWLLEHDPSMPPLPPEWEAFIERPWGFEHAYNRMRKEQRQP